MSQFRKIVESILVNTSFMESEQKVNWILSQPKLVQQLENRIKTDSKTPKNITTEQLLKNFDNTSNVIGKFLPWIIKHYCNNEFEYTDLGLINNYLKNFTTNINKIEKKDINAYKSLDELISVLDDIKDVKGTKEKNRESKANAEKIYEDNKWLILIPHTKEAAIQYGKGTRWCTAGINDNMFDYYNKEGPLYILINKQNPSEKYQFQFETDQYKDVKDHEINLSKFLKENPEIRKFFRNLKSIDKSNYQNWIWFSPEELTKKDCLEVVKEDGYALKFVPEQLIEYDMCLEAVKNYGRALKFVPEQLIDYKMCLEAVKENDYALEFVPEQLKNYDMCLETVKSNGSVLGYVPEKFRNYDMCLEAVKDYGEALKFVPEQLIDYKMCLEAVKDYGYALKNVPEQLKDYNLCLEAVKNDWLALQYVPEKFKSRIKQELGF